ncbi:hypothetical protein [Pseudomonas sp. NDM]|uniref:hypothetical protein n=1 Tax=Pseudomonas sp. NDM TaxID=2170733 RepID=UPI001057B922|nr:hypothetical protein [Pseudomonas sp. NDM]
MKSTSAASKVVSYLGQSMAVSHPLRVLKDEISDLAIFGGMIRDLTIGKPEDFQSDIDLVSTATSDQIFSIIKAYSPVRNRFGGYRFRHLGRDYDIWSLQDTWAVREGYVAASCIEDLCKTTFFTVDAAIFSFKDKMVYAPEFYSYSIKERVLDINLVHNPCPERMAAKAIYLALEKEFCVSNQLAEFILCNFQWRESRGIFLDYFNLLMRHQRMGQSELFRYARQLNIEF